MKVGDQAPQLGLQDQDGKVHQIDDHAGHWLVLYFYPKDDTPGCTKEACAFRDEMADFEKMDTRILGISTDTPDRHAAFARKFRLSFPLLSDPGGKAARRYGALLNLGIARLAKRHSFIIDPAGQIARIYRKVEPATHTQTVLADLQALQSEGHH